MKDYRSVYKKHCDIMYEWRHETRGTPVISNVVNEFDI